MVSPTRRVFLAFGGAAAAQLLCGCSDGSGHGTGPGGAKSHPDPDQPLRLRAVAATDTLLAAYDSLLAGPGAAQADRLKPLRADLLAHRAALATGLPSASPSVSPSASASTTASPTTAPPASVAALAAAERQAAGARLADLLAASPALAAVLASVSASDALHAAALGDTGPITAPRPAAAPAPSATKSPLPESAVAALQIVLAAEHTAVYGYGVVGAHLPAGAQRDDARTSYTTHQARRDAWQRLLISNGETPVAAAPGYRLPFPVTTPGSAGDLAVHIEAQLAAVYARLVAATTGPLRLTAAEALRESALNTRHWGGTMPALPGLPAPTAPARTPAPSASPSA